VFSPHLLPPQRGGSPQVRERVFIVGTYVGTNRSHEDVAPAVPHAPVDGWDPQSWSLAEHLPLEEDLSAEELLRLRLSPAETTWVEAWNDFVVTLRAAGVKRLPGFPVWVDEWVHEADLVIPFGTPAWKENFLRKNAAFYTEHQATLELWKARWDGLADFPASRRKFEWQAQHAESLEETILHFRPSGVRAKRATYTPALVAITQTSILGDQKRRLSTKEAARLQGLPDWFDFGDQPVAATYKQLGNGVNVGAATHVFTQHIRRDIKPVRKRAPGLAGAVVRGESRKAGAALEAAG
jgi:DNA (cytosine-5)-methyltransferase 1